MPSQEANSRILRPLLEPKTYRPLLAAGFILDAAHKLSNVYHILPPDVLGRDTFLENHIGNFGMSAILTSFVRNKVLDNMGLFKKMEKRKGEEYTNKLKNILAFTSVAMLYIAWETVPYSLGGVKNPEMVGDIAVGLAAPLLYLASYPKHRKSIFF